MSKNMRARIVSVDALGQTTALVGFHVTLNGTGSPGTGLTDVSGHFDITYRKDHSEVGRHRTLELVVQDVAGRVLPINGMHPVSSSPVFSVDRSGRVTFQDVDDEQIIVGDFTIRKADATGFLVTLGTGETPVTDGDLTSVTVASGWGLSHGNAVTLLSDKDIFSHAAGRFRAAQQSILLTQYNFTLPEVFNADPTRETTKVVFEFDPPDPAENNLPRPVRVQDARPERLIFDAGASVEVRMLFHALKLPRFLKIILGALIFPFAGSDGIFTLGGLLDDFTSTDEAKRYFNGTGRSNIKVQDFQQPFFNFGIMHARLVIVDELHAMCMGASFVQSYVDTHDHSIDAPVRGDSEGLPDHDVGIGITGPAVGDLHQNLKLLWNTAAPAERLSTIGRNPPRQASGGEGICSIQIVRTLTKNRFEEPPFGNDPRVNDPTFDPSEGEKGILEAYLRAFANAQGFIYLENQYLTDDAIGGGLVNVLKAKPDLQVIVVLNIRPDASLLPYSFWQRRMITRIRLAIGETPADPKQFGVFTRWTHATHETGQTRPRILPIYIHAKVGIVDDKWATVGSANLDGASMERAIEVNANMLNGVDGGPESDVVDILRRKLWAEHLGYSVAPGVPDPAAAELISPPAGGWLQLWKDRAAATLQQLRDTPSLALTGSMARVLPWPSDNTTHKTPRAYLGALGIRSDAIVPLKSTRAFDFKTGNWKLKSKAKMDY